MESGIPSDPYRISGEIDEYETLPGGDLLKHEIVDTVKLISGGVDQRPLSVKGGTYIKQAVHVCSPPDADEMPKGIKFTKGDSWKCNTCSKTRWWQGMIWSEFEP